MTLQIRHDDRPDGSISTSLFSNGRRLAEMNRAHAHREIDVLVGGQPFRAREKRRLVLAEDQQVLLGPHDQACAGTRFPAAAVRGTSRAAASACPLNIGAPSARHAAFGDPRHLTRNEEIDRPVQRSRSESTRRSVGASATASAAQQRSRRGRRRMADQACGRRSSRSRDARPARTSTRTTQSGT